MFKSKEMSPTDLDILKEISNIGMGNALTSLSQLVNQPINMSVPKAGFFPIEDVISFIGGEEMPVSCVSLRVLGDLNGTVLFVFDEPGTYTLIDLLMGQPEGFTSEIDELGESAIREVGNILTGSFINAISVMAQLRMVTTTPVFGFDMLGAILTSIIIASDRIEEKILVIESMLFKANQEVKGYFFFLAEPETIDKLVEALGLSQQPELRRETYEY